MRAENSQRAKAAAPINACPSVSSGSGRHAAVGVLAAACRDPHLLLAVAHEPPSDGVWICVRLSFRDVCRSRNSRRLAARTRIEVIFLEWTDGSVGIAA